MEPQPALHEPVWQGNTEGVIIECFYPSAGNYDNPYALYEARNTYWSPTTPTLGPDPVELARRAIATMNLQPVVVATLPAASVDPPGMLINLPTYLWAANPAPASTGTTTATATDQGLTVVATATLTHTTWDTGDGTVITCAPEAITSAPLEWGRDHPPDCGHTWSRTGTYTLTATSHWNVTWRGAGQTGTLNHSLATTTEIGVTDAPVRLVRNPGE